MIKTIFIKINIFHQNEIESKSWGMTGVILIVWNTVKMTLFFNCTDFAKGIEIWAIHPPFPVSKVHVEEAGMTAYLFKLNTEKTIYCKNVTWVVTDGVMSILIQCYLICAPVMKPVGWFPRKSIIGLYKFLEFFISRIKKVKKTHQNQTYS